MEFTCDPDLQSTRLVTLLFLQINPHHNFHPNKSKYHNTHLYYISDCVPGDGRPLTCASRQNPYSLVLAFFNYFSPPKLKESFFCWFFSSFTIFALLVLSISREMSRSLKFRKLIDIFFLFLMPWLPLTFVPLIHWA